MRGGGGDVATAVDDPVGAIGCGRAAFVGGAAGGCAGIEGADGEEPPHAAIASALGSHAQRCMRK